MAVQLQETKQNKNINRFSFASKVSLFIFTLHFRKKYLRRRQLRQRTSVEQADPMHDRLAQRHRQARIATRYDREQRRRNWQRHNARQHAIVVGDVEIGVASRLAQMRERVDVLLLQASQFECKLTTTITSRLSARSNVIYMT